MRLENSELRAFRAVIEEGGFNRAAEVLHLHDTTIYAFGQRSRLGPSCLIFLLR